MNPQTDHPSVIDSEQFAKLITKGSPLYLNISQEFIVTTEDKIRLVLNEYLKRLENSRRWLIPLSIVLPLGLALLTCTFEDKLGLIAAEWHAIFTIAFVACGIWLLIWAISAVRSKAVEDITSELKKGSLKPEDIVSALEEPIEILTPKTALDIAEDIIKSKLVD